MEHNTGKFFLQLYDKSATAYQSYQRPSDNYIIRLASIISQSVAVTMQILQGHISANTTCNMLYDTTSNGSLIIILSSFNVD